MSHRSIAWLIATVIASAHAPLPAAWAQDSQSALSPANDGPLQGLSNRWRLLDAYGVQPPPASLFNPYNQNPLKGDFPFLGLNTFGVLTLLYNPQGNFTSIDSVDAQFAKRLVCELALEGVVGIRSG